ncbi:MAG: tRNA (guanosine(46)-N7)-methyltransferase TrmB, partial [Bacilli bacterium]|nr:tRNA (guanosine(46)-N7)-methyltransferase TrmB [Bacilli bacterium]
MRYNVVKDADVKIGKSSYLVKNPMNYKNKWSDFFGNKNPIHIELGMGRGDFIVNMAKKYPNINFIGLELYASQMVMAVERLSRLDLP